MPENLLTTFVHAVDLIFDLSYLIKFFFFFFFLMRILNQMRMFD